MKKKASGIQRDPFPNATLAPFFTSSVLMTVFVWGEIL